MAVLIEFLSSTSMRAYLYLIGHIIFFFTNFLNFFYLMLYELFITGRWRRNIIFQLMTIAVVAQMISCVTSIARWNIDDEYNKTLSWMGNTATHIAQIPLNICAVYLFFNVNYKKYMMPAVIVAVCISVSATIMTYVFWDSLLFLPSKVLFLSSGLWQIAAIISALGAHRKGKLHGPVAHDVMTRQFTVSIVVHCTVIACLLSGRPLFVYGSSGLFWMNYVALGMSSLYPVLCISILHFNPLVSMLIF